MENISVFLTQTDVVRRLHVNDSLVAKLIDDGSLPGFYLGGQWLTTEKALGTWGEAMIARDASGAAPMEERAIEETDAPKQMPQSDADENLFPLPTLADARTAKWEKVGPLRSTSQQENGTVWGFVFTVGDKEVPILIEIYGPRGRGVYQNWGATAYFGKAGHGPQPLVEWQHTSDYKNTRKLASAIKIGRNYARPDAPLPFSQDYGQLELDIYNKVITRSNTRYAWCVVSHEDDLGTIAIHALIRCRQNGII